MTPDAVEQEPKPFTEAKLLALAEAAVSALVFANRIIEAHIENRPITFVTLENYFSEIAGLFGHAESEGSLCSPGLEELADELFSQTMDRKP